jgi:hypothetical protein
MAKHLRHRVKLQEVRVVSALCCCKQQVAADPDRQKTSDL